MSNLWMSHVKMCTWMSHVTQCTLLWGVGRVIVEWIHTHEPCHVWTSHVSFMNESCAYVHVNESCHTWAYAETVLVCETGRRRMNPYEWAMPRVNASRHVWMSHVTLMNEWFWHVHINGWYHTWVCVHCVCTINGWYHTWVCVHCVCPMNGWYHTWVCVHCCSHISHRDVRGGVVECIHMNEPCHVWMHHVTCEWVMSHLWMSHVNVSTWMGGITHECVFRLFRTWEALPYNEHIWTGHYEWVISHMNG